MSTDDPQVTVLTGALNRKIQAADAVLERLNKGETLSSVLNLVRQISVQDRDERLTAFVNIMIYGAYDIPESIKTYSSRARMEAATDAMELLSVADSRKVPELIRRGETRGRPSRNLVLSASISTLEQTEPPEKPDRLASEQVQDMYVIQHSMHSETVNALNRARAFIYQCVARIGNEALLERDALSLLGPDYRLVIDSLSALETEVGQELHAALTNLSSTNPAHWALAALGCRNVVLKMGRLLWQCEVPTFQSKLHKTVLQLTPDKSGPKELNQLHAYIAFHWAKVFGEDQVRLNEADQLAHKVYSEGSGGKASVKYSKARDLVVQTFSCVAVLRDITGLEPLHSV